MPPFFGYGERFKEPKEHTPGPGEYDPSKAKGFKADPKSGFTGKERFNESDREEGELSILSLSCWAAERMVCLSSSSPIAYCPKYLLFRRAPGIFSSQGEEKYASCRDERRWPQVLLGNTAHP